MVTVAVRHNDEVEVSQIDNHSFYVVLKNFDTSVYQAQYWRRILLNTLSSHFRFARLSSKS
jgi:hypothetical protein